MTKRHVVITGASRGIGRAAWDIFAKNDWFVIGIGRSPMGGDIPELGYFIQADVSYEKDWQKIKKETSDITDQLDAIVNNAAIQITKPILDTTVEEWDQVLNANLRSVFLSVKIMHPLLKAGNGGAIVNISSVHAVATSKEIAAYAASKGGMLALTRALAIELAPDNIRVNTVLPGAVDTEMLKAGLNRDHAGGGSAAQRLENLARKTVSGKIGTPEEIARAIYFLADNDQSSFITGQPLVIDGGATARLSTE
ncbi:MAG: SDR family oxidoreductase [Anaerolineales bacterium]|nr:SDR family oxidoreductase [Anaerolineales bacterium]